MTTAEQLAEGDQRTPAEPEAGFAVGIRRHFGGRIDNVHILVSAEADGDRLVLSFEEGETLQIWNPARWHIDSRVFTITKAIKVRWEWFYYGRDRTRPCPRSDQLRAAGNFCRDSTSLSGLASPIQAIGSVGWGSAR
jgi:hypothetical protein